MGINPMELIVVDNILAHELKTHDHKCHYFGISFIDLLKLLK